jgi:hypothetical protein
MFFRNAKPHEWNFSERIASLKPFGFESSVQGGSSARVTRKGFGIVVTDGGDGKVKLGKPGLLVGTEIALLTNGGYQMFFVTPGGKEIPALADQLKALHAFDEDLREGLGLTSLYNRALGTVSEEHLYDRLEDRDAAPPPHPWEKKVQRA